MGARTDLQKLLEQVLGSNCVYFQPPPTVQMYYPCIVYSRFSGNTIFASDNPYRHKVQYQIILIGKDPDHSVLFDLAMIPTSMFVRHYTANNLNHDVFNLYW